MAAASAVVLPFLFKGIPSGHDFEFHVNSWMEVLSQWKQGILYPRWAALAHYEYGEARFVFYPPASWTLGTLLGVFLPWKVVPGAYVWTALTLSGSSMFVLARRWLSRGDAIFAAAFYACNPYYIVIVYWRSAYAELLAGALLPLLLLLLLDEEDGILDCAIPLSLVVAAAWLTNLPTAVMVNYSVALLAVVFAAVRRSWRPLISAGAAVLIALMLAAFSIFPAAIEERWVNIAEVLSPGVRPQDNFLFSTVADPDHNRFNLLVSVVAFSEIALLAGALFLTRSWRKRSPREWWTLMAWAVAATLAMFSFTFVAWELLPKLRFIQLPWRWLLCLNVVLVLTLSMAWKRWYPRLLICAALLLVLAAVWIKVQPPWWDTAADLAVMQEDVRTSKGYEGVDEYVPSGADPYEINQNARRVTFEGAGHASIHVLRWNAEDRAFSAEVSTEGKLVMRLFNYPAWRVEVNGRVVPAETRDVTGQMEIPVAAGKNTVDVRFTRTWDRTAGASVSGGALLLLIGLGWMRKKR